MCTDMHTLTHTSMHAHMCMYSHSHAFSHKYTCTYTHVHTDAQRTYAGTRAWTHSQPKFCSSGLCGLAATALFTLQTTMPCHSPPFPRIWYGGLFHLNGRPVQDSGLGFVFWLLSFTIYIILLLSLDRSLLDRIRGLLYWYNLTALLNMWPCFIPWCHLWAWTLESVTMIQGCWKSLELCTQPHCLLPRKWAGKGRLPLPSLLLTQGEPRRPVLQQILSYCVTLHCGNVVRKPTRTPNSWSFYLCSLEIYFSFQTKHFSYSSLCETLYKKFCCCCCCCFRVG